MIKTVFRRKARTRRRGFFSKARRHVGRHSSEYGSVGIFLGGAAYGYIREYANGLIKPLTDKIPMGDAADNIALGLAAYFTKKYVKNPMVHQVCNAALAVEGAMLGQEIKSGNILGTSTNGTKGGLW